jgi:hypothetical protein
MFYNSTLVFASQYPIAIHRRDIILLTIAILRQTLTYTNIYTGAFQTQVTATACCWVGTFFRQIDLAVFPNIFIPKYSVKISGQRSSSLTEAVCGFSQFRYVTIYVDLQINL